MGSPSGTVAAGRRAEHVTGGPSGPLFDGIGRGGAVLQNDPRARPPRRRGESHRASRSPGFRIVRTERLNGTRLVSEEMCSVRDADRPPPVQSGPPRYEPPTLTDLGTLLDLCADGSFIDPT